MRGGAIRAARDDRIERQALGTKAAHGFLELALHLKLSHAFTHKLNDVLERRIGDGLGGAHGRKLALIFHCAHLFHETIGLGKARLPLRLAKCPFELAEFTQLNRVLDTHGAYVFALGCARCPMECRELPRNPGSMGAAACVNDPRCMLRCAIARIGITGIGMHEGLLRRHKRQMSRFVVKDAFKFSEPLHIGNIAAIKIVDAACRHVLAHAFKP